MVGSNFDVARNGRVDGLPGAAFCVRSLSGRGEGELTRPAGLRSDISPERESSWSSVLGPLLLSSASRTGWRSVAWSMSELGGDSPHQPEATPPLDNATNVILIDNFDSFTWNIYQYLVLEGASVTVFRNDAITVEALSALNPTQLVISPGPGHPKTDSGVSRDAIQYFAGKIPILGVCMGQ